MDELLNFANKIIDFASTVKIDELIADAGKNVEEEMADLNVEQLGEGILSTGKKITPEYSPSYAAYKGFKTPNLKDEGDFHSGLFVDTTRDYFTFDSTDFKTEKLESKYSNEIFGIAPKNYQKQADFIDPYLLTIIENKML